VAKKVCSFLREVFSDQGVGSFSNVATAVILAFSIYWVTYLVLKDGKLPDMSGLALFIGTLYGVKKVAGAVSESITGKK
jgi:hypothetical protein